jgi:two-component system chemotaxis response regulator CheB
MKTIKSMAKVKVIKRFPRKEKNVSHVEAKAFMNASDGPHGIEVIVIGGSTGAPPVLKTIFSCLCPHFSIPVFVVQHISPGFLVGMLEWLSKDLPFSFKIAENDQQIMPGTITFAPEDAHLSLRADNRLHVSQEPLENGLRPSVAPLFRSAAVHFGKRALGILLTGMGKDGAKELKLLHNHGGITIAQDKASSIVHGMPGEAIALKGADLIYSPPEISRYLNSLIKDTKTACFQSNHSH